MANDSGKSDIRGAFTSRALVFGLFVGLFISGFTYINDALVRGTYLIGNFLPIGVFGILLLFLILVNPILRLIGRRLPLRPGELAVITALGLAACGWPASNFYRVAIPNVAMPAGHLERTRISWQAQNVMSYVPGGPATLAQGHITDWQAFASAIVDAAESPEAEPGDGLWAALSSDVRQQFEVATRRAPDVGTISTLTRGLNAVIGSVSIYDAQAFEQVELNETAATLLMRSASERTTRQTARLNRALLVSAMPDLVLPPPEGTGVLLWPEPRRPEITDALLEGWSGDESAGLDGIPWGAWWPVIRLWGGLAVLLGVCSLCLAVIVHPQWSQRELLPYPIARFVKEITARNEKAWFPQMVSSRLFWAGAGLVFAVHLLNGFHAWFEAIPEFPRALNFMPLMELFPNARRAWMSAAAFHLIIYPTAIAFAFFLDTRVAFTLGITNYVWIAFAGTLIANGIAMQSTFMQAGESNLIRFGGYIAFALMILYTGRRYYLNVAKSTFGAPRGTDTPRYAVWAARGLLIAMVLALALLRSSGLDLVWCIALWMLMLLIVTVMSRIVAETGAFFIQAWWMPVAIMTVLFGIEVIGPTSYIIMGVACVMLVGDPRTAVMPFLTNGLKMFESGGGIKPGKAASAVLPTLIIGFIVAGAVTMVISYNVGVNQHDTWATRVLPGMPFDQLARYTSDMASKGTLSESTGRSGLAGFAAFAPERGAWLWASVGFVLVLVCALARLRLPHWPIHPVLFLVWGTYPMGRIGGSFLLGWMIKAGVVKTGGAKGYHAVKPLMIGLIVGDLFGGLLWIAVGLLYYWFTGQTPQSYTIFPG